MYPQAADQARLSYTMCLNSVSCSMLNQPGQKADLGMTASAGTSVQYLLQSLGPLDAERQQFFGFKLCSHPILRWLQVPIAFLAPQNRHLLLDRGSDVDLGSNATHAHVGRVAHDGSTTETTQPAGKIRGVVRQGSTDQSRSVSTDADVHMAVCMLLGN